MIWFWFDSSTPAFSLIKLHVARWKLAFMNQLGVYHSIQQCFIYPNCKQIRNSLSIFTFLAVKEIPRMEAIPYSERGWYTYEWRHDWKWRLPKWNGFSNIVTIQKWVDCDLIEVENICCNSLSLCIHLDMNDNYGKTPVNPLRRIAHQQKVTWPGKQNWLLSLAYLQKFGQFSKFLRITRLFN